MSNMVTRCPQCRTSFRVTEEHLKIANGAVRCGSCLLVFQARQHWVNPEHMAAASTPAPEVQTTPGKFRFDQSAIDNGAAAKTATPQADSTAAVDNKLPSKPFDLRAAAGLAPATADQPNVAATPAHHRKLEDIGDDDKISDDLDLEDDQPVIVPKKTAVAEQTGFGLPDDDYSSVFDDFEEQATGDHFDNALNEDFNDIDALASDENESDGDQDPVSDDAWAKQMLAELEHEKKPQALDLNTVNDVRDILTDFTNPVDVDAARRDLGFDRPDPFAARDPGTAPPQRGGDGRAEMIAHIEPLPVDLLSTRSGKAANLKSLLVWNSMVVVLAALLVTQYVFFNFDRLAKTSTSRPYMHTLCQVLGCKLPAVENWRYIKIQNLVVRKHPQVADALAVDAILLNVTEQELPFPKLELYFSDMVKTPVASRRFEPAEYLSGELAGQTMIPAGRPVHIALEIMNPGDAAVNWSLQVAGKTE